MQPKRARTERLWKEYWRDPWQWWDNRKSKTIPSAPDFKHKLTKESLWINGWYNPSWLGDRLSLVASEEPCAMHKSAQEEGKEELKQNNHYSNNSSGCGWEMLSLEEALPFLEDGRLPQPSIEDLERILCKCRNERDRALVHRLRVYMHDSGMEAHRSLGNYLILMLVEVGSMHEAQQVFDRLLYRNESSWNSLITGYIKRGKPQHALNLYQKMQEDNSVHPNGHTYVALLKACAKIKDLERGLQIHANLARTRLLESDFFVGSTLVNMYAKCGSLCKAQQVFDKLSVRDVVSWTALIAGYAEHGHGEEALKRFEQMQLEGVSPNAVTFTCSLKACSSIGAIDKGQEIHAEIEFLETDLVVGSTLVHMYAKCGLLAKAQKLFDKLPTRNVVSWNSLIAGYAEHGCNDEALKCFEQMQLEGVAPNAVTFVCSLKACGSIGAIDKGREIHTEIERKGLLKRNLFVGSTLVDMYAKCGSVSKAQQVFDELPARNVVSWTALITGYAEHGYDKEALNCFEQMQLEGVSPNAVTFVHILKACGTVGATDKGTEIHAEIERKGLLQTDQVIGNTLVDMYAKCGSLAKAQEVFDKLPVRDVVPWTALIAGYADHGQGEEALKCFEQMQLKGVSPNAFTFACSLKACSSIGATDKSREIHAEIERKGFLGSDLFVGNALVDMYAKFGSLAKAQEVFDSLPVRDVVSWTVLIAGYADHGHGEEALRCFEKMQLEGVSPNALTFICILKACGSIGAIDKGQEIHAEIVKKGFVETDLVVGNTLIDMYAKCGSLAKAQEVFNKLLVRDIVSWTALIAGYARLGESENVFYIFDRLIGEGIKPNLVTFVTILNACRHTGLFDKGKGYFEAMSKDYGIVPTPEHHTCMVDLFGRAGQLDKAVATIKKLPFCPNLAVWHTLLGACKKWGNVELGRQVFEHAVGLDEKDVAAYVLMSSINASV